MPGFDAVVELSSLDGTNGFQINPEVNGDQGFAIIGVAVASAGDVNGDGLGDLLIGAPGADPTGEGSGATYVVFGSAEPFDSDFDVADLDGLNGFQLNGEEDSLSAAAIASAGDFNGDGFADVIIEATNAHVGEPYGATYVVFGQENGFAAEIDLPSLSEPGGFKIDGGGSSVSSAGDFNGDGLDDLIIGARSANTAYVMFGTAEDDLSSFSFSDLDGSNGFRIHGESELDFAGASVASAGDINGDGFDDLIIGAPYAESVADYGSVYVVFGRSGGMPADLDLSTLDGTNGFQITSLSDDFAIGSSVASAGDVNGDGYDDLLMEAGRSTGYSFVIFGTEESFAPEVDLSALDGTNGFKIIAENPPFQKGFSVSSAGDMNGDGFDDVIIGNYHDSASYVVFGSGDGFPAVVDLEELNGTNGFRIDGEEAYDRFGLSVASAGDVNGDGFDDVIVGAPEVGGYFDNVGACYVVFGEATAPVTRSGTSGDDRLFGGDFSDSLTGNGGNDLLDGRSDADRLDGGPGDDTYIVDNAGDQVVEAGGGGTDLVEASSTVTLAANVENLTLSGSSAISGTGNLAANIITGNSANNVLTGKHGNDTLNGLAGHDKMVGGDGNDTYVVDSSGDVVREAANRGTDLVQSLATFTLSANVENLTLTGSDNIGGSGNSANNVLTGNGGANTLNGLAGHDKMVGGDGNDTYIVDSSGDVVQEKAGEGTDLVQASATFTLSANVENLTLTGSSAINATGNSASNVLTGNSANNVLTGLGGNDTLDGRGGHDKMVGGDGDDTYVVDSSGDVVVELSNGGTDTVQASLSYALGGNLNKLTLTGSAAISGTGNGSGNTLTGNTGKNTLDGAAGSDKLIGGGGDDKLIGGVDADTFVFHDGDGSDTVTDFENGVDTFDLRGVTGVEDRGDLHLIDTGSDVLVDYGSGSFVVEGVAGTSVLDSGDFIFA